jgi:hypothetical protein
LIAVVLMVALTQAAMKKLATTAYHQNHGVQQHSTSGN